MVWHVKYSFNTDKSERTLHRNDKSTSNNHSNNCIFIAATRNPLMYITICLISP